MTIQVKFWGVRGSIACPSPTHMQFGGNTSCVEMRAGDELVIFDAGTGIRNLGQSLIKGDLRQATLLLSHTHWDHIDGFPFFAPIYDKNFTLTIKAGHLQKMGGIKKVLSTQMSNPVFPVPLEALSAHWTIGDFHAGDSFMLGAEGWLHTTLLRHPGGATGYRLEHGGRSVCYVTDVEHVPGAIDTGVLQLIQGADLVIYDSTYTDGEFPTKIGWGHSTWQEAVRLAQAAEVQQLAIFHHDPSHDDSFLEDVERDARLLWKNAFIAREGMTVSVG